ncbi:TPA: L-arabinose ABC transporter ATP-binding protein AraG [Vibrio parahaemolyticus]|uniref:L-arabinose ABC transporter ATP-binding protein AraG n=1 Tax=Vibrio parahaemolyticus TaxID=670 RepID=UPI0004A2452F|nr:L-arabinose ABC transporter ATP-binding protein AraG [Vibrio parahaemolyticus]EKN4605778.1 L-arabinose ABC transporter ATP-binding protein AraG [Vibrio parahaemolyticus]ELR9973000.1 L-arabinose ABC transporter ATP-binding protein AraG [Vibrio parahaemolyticus]MBE3737957.1 L-arabinose ABC transporter ATP-binding protein AraG [Vibrio parahaemolyticus]MBE3772524.1 L-arabinose ABC transporter ATP-binding protein AraG [Vibrio parahaemolyticus]MBE4126713.1 L-arabinose ABC transporter ATP-binding 
MINSPSYLEFCNISKHFPGVKALSNISFRANKGSIHALMGENGAGKSTLLKTLSGLHQPTEGELVVDGKALVFNSATDALEQGIAIIYQELNLVPELSVAENIYLGQLPTKGGSVDVETLNARAREQLKRLGEDFDPSRPLKEFSIGQWQMVEIAKALSRNAQIIAFDEPTSSLSQREIQNLFKVIRELRDDGKIILYVSHRMEEIFDLCDAITIFKDGTHVQTFDDMTDLTHEKLVELMVGREINDIYNYRSRPLGESGLRIENLEGKGLTQPVSLDIRQGEILGLFGLVGAGRTELTRLIFGAEKAQAGQIYIHGQPISVRSPQDAIRAGITLCPEDRKADAIVPILSVEENTNISARPWNLKLGGLIDFKWERDNAEQQRKALNVKTASLQQAIGQLSGGNQQKVILGRWLSTDMSVILLDEPTRGIDVGAKSEIYELIFNLAERGVTVLVVSSDLPEVLGISDRVMVMKEGAVTGELQRHEFKEQTALSLAMLGNNQAAA